MARSEKKSFVLYYDLEQHVQLLSDEQLGRLLRAVFAYEIRGEITEFNDPMLSLCFSFIKVQLDIDNEKYRERCEKNTENGKNGGRPPKNNNFDEPPPVNNNSNKTIAIPQKGKEFNNQTVY